jgi:hypothetical protein
MDPILLNKIIHETTYETTVELYKLAQQNLEVLRDNLKSYSDAVWEQISQTALPDNFIREFKDKVDWRWISGNNPLYEDFIQEFEAFVDWEAVSRYQNLSEDFIRNYKDKVDWKWISRYQSLSEDFIREFQDKMEWK